MTVAAAAAAAPTVSTGAAPAIAVERVAKTFDANVRALQSVTFGIARGQFVSVLGPSGCGKSTLLRIVAGLVTPDPGGAVTVLGSAAGSVPEQIGVVFQTHNMLPWLTVRENMRLAGEIRGVPRAELDRRVDGLLRVLKLEHFRNNHPHQLSGGMRQRAALGQILALHPQVLLLDEPFGALDALTRDQLNLELLRLWQELRITVLLITHSIAEAVFLSDRVIVMSDRPGRVIEDLEIDLPRPRSAESKALPAFGKYILHLNQLMGVQ